MGIFDLIGLIIGLVYLYFEYNANKLVWVVGLIMPINSMIVYFNKGLYADFGINIYYLLITIYGFVLWNRKTGPKGSSGKETLPITHTPVNVYFGAGTVTLALWAALWWLLVTFTNSTVPVADAFTTALSIVAYWMMARKYAEQWIAWFIVDAVCVFLYVYKGLIFYPILYGIYTVISIFGYRKWSQMAVRA